MIRTLVVEDDPVVAEVNSSYLKRVAGFVAVGVARSGAEAIAAAQDQPVDLVLLDFYLPDMSGLDVCRALRAARPPPVDIIAVTAARDVDTVRAAIAHGVVQYLIKPYNFATFREKLQRYARDCHPPPTSWSSVSFATPTSRSQPPRLPTPRGCPGSAPVATSITCTTRDWPCSPSATAPPDDPNTDTSGPN
jgi:CheY-like chemotaxis protein